MKTIKRASFLAALFLLATTVSAATRTWTGAGGDALWSNGKNWDGGVVPVSGDDLVFGGQSTTNDLTGLSLHSITVTSGSPVFSGNTAPVGTLHVAGGAVALTGSIFSVLSNTTVDGGSLDLQFANIGNATVNGGTLEVTSQHGSSTVDSLRLGPSAQFTADLYETFWATGTDYLTARGAVSLGGSMLALNPLMGSPTQTHTLIHNVGPYPIEGTFAGLPEGAIFQRGLWYRITYQGGSSGRDVAIVMLAGSTMTLTTAQQSPNYGEPIYLRANIRGPYGIAVGAPIGTVEFFDGVTSLGIVPVSGGAGNLTTYLLTPGAHVLTAHYSGGGNLTPVTSPPITRTVVPGQIATITTLADLPPAALAGQFLSLTAFVRTTGLVPSGNVTFLDGGTSLGSASLDPTGRAMLNTSLPAGTHSISARFDGSSIFNTSLSSPVTLTVNNDAVTQTALSVSANPAVAGMPVLLHATVVAPYGIPQGRVVFMDASTPMGFANVDSDRTASLTVTTLTPGSHMLAASYLGGTGFTVSTSAALEQKIVASSSDCAPVIVVPPADAMLSSAGTATLSVTADSGPPETFQWYLGSYPDMSHPLGTAAAATVSTASDVWVLVTNVCGITHASAHVAPYVPARRRAAGH